MRKTLEIDDDVAILLNEEMRRSGVPFKQAVNHYLRLGLIASKRPMRKKFVVKPIAMGLPIGLSYDNIGELLDVIEGPAHR